MHPMLNIAIRAARNAGNLIIRSLQHVDHIAVTTKSRNDYVSDVDRLAEKEIINVITYICFVGDFFAIMFNTLN